MSTIALLRSGFCKSVFLSRNSKAIENVILRVINNPNVTLFPNKPNKVKVETIDGMSDKVTLSFDDEEVTSIWTWNMSENGKRYVVNKIE